MGKSRYEKIYHKASEIRKKADKEVVNNQCECPHQDSDGFSIDIVHRGDEKAYRCYNCQKIISIVAPKKGEVEEAMDTIDTALDNIKMQLNLKNENQCKILDLTAQCQKLLRKLTPVYYQMLSEAVNKSKKNKKGHRDGAIMHLD